MQIYWRKCLRKGAEQARKTFQPDVKSNLMKGKEEGRRNGEKESQTEMQHSSMFVTHWQKCPGSSPRAVLRHWLGAACGEHGLDLVPRPPNPRPRLFADYKFSRKSEHGPLRLP